MVTAATSSAISPNSSAFSRLLPTDRVHGVQGCWHVDTVLSIGAVLGTVGSRCCVTQLEYRLKTHLVQFQAVNRRIRVSPLEIYDGWCPKMDTHTTDRNICDLLILCLTVRPRLGSTDRVDIVLSSNTLAFTYPMGTTGTKKPGTCPALVVMVGNYAALLPANR